MTPVKFYEMFPFLKGNKKLSADYAGARVVSAVIDKSKTSMKLNLSLKQPVPPYELREIESLIEKEFGFEAVEISPAYSLKSPARHDTDEKSSPDSSTIKPAKQKNTVILGRNTKADITPMKDITLDSDKVAILGDVCDVSSAKSEKTGAWRLRFDLTDYSNTIQVFKHMRDESAKHIVKQIKKGMRLKVSGTIYFDRYTQDMALDPINIVALEKTQRQDTANQKRAELHLHTKMSTLDAVTDIADAISQAAKWGHPAIAITDHGVVHSFPHAHAAQAKAGGKIKVIYGLEGYFVNDVDAYMSVADNENVLRHYKFDDEFVVFDIETTGLSAIDDVIIEIGAVLVKDGKETAKFSTFVNPEKPIPYKITNITGIRDEDVKDAPSQSDAVKSFIDFVSGRPLVAHNASFDVGFIYEACHKYQIAYTPLYIDTLALARALYPDMPNHRLETLANRLTAGGYNHHRASDDAAATMLIFCSLLDKLRASGVNEVGQVNTHLMKLRDTSTHKQRGRNKHIILLAKNNIGLKNLYKLVTKSHLEHFKSYPIIHKSLLMEYKEGLIIGSACEAGELFDAVSNRQSDFTLRQIANFYDYLEIQPVCNNMFMLDVKKPRANDIEELRDFNRRIVALGKALGKPVVATGDVHFLDPEHEIFRHILLTSKGYDDAGSNLPIYLKTTDEMLDEFSYLGEDAAYEVVVKNSRLIADMCENISPLPPAKTLYPPKLDNSARILEESVKNRLALLYGDNPPDLITDLLKKEMAAILTRNYDVIYVAAQKLVDESIRNGYLVGSRGSVGCSIVAFLMGITEVNALPAHYRCPNCCNSDFDSGKNWGCGADMPDLNCPKCGEQYIKDGFNIPFETFLGFDGDKVPDIDLNFSGKFQAQAHKLTTELFGAENVYRSGTINTIAQKTAYGHVKNYLEKNGRTVTKAEENRLTNGCTGVKRTTGQHPGGQVIIPQGTEITDFCPAQHPADSSEKNIITTHFEYEWLEDNLIKLDALGHDDPTMIKMLEDMTDVNAKDIKFDDKSTMSIFTSPLPLGLPEDDNIIGKTGTIGIPEFGTTLTRQMLCDTKPDNFDTLVRLSGISHGEDVWLGNARDLIMSGIAGVSDTISCRDDIMLFLISKGIESRVAFSVSESVRRGRGLPNDTEKIMIEHGIPQWYIESCKKIKYLFPKAHAVAYVMMAFRIAWFKAHKPLAFYSAYFYRRSQKDAFDAECMIRGIRVVKSKIREIQKNIEIKAAKAKDKDLLITLEACYEFYLRGFDFTHLDLYDSDPTMFLLVGDKKLRPPLIAVNGLGETTAFDVASTRMKTEFISIEDISAACSKLSKTNIEQLKALGALRDLPDSSQFSMF